MFNVSEQRELLTIAREAVECALDGKQPSRYVPKSASLCRAVGVFVTIKVGDELRGCIGYVESEKPLHETVAEVAVKAATEDPRFPRMSLGEFRRARIEISILSQPRRIHAIQEIEIGKHGVIVVDGERRGLLLPQVAVEHSLDREAFLEAAKRKAGIVGRMGELARQPELYVFEAEIVREDPSAADASGVVRPPAVAGMFYPAEPDLLHKQIEELFHQVETKKLKGKVRGLVSPHAGYLYSGLTAAHGYALLSNEAFDTVVVVSPSHREFFSGVSVYSGDAYETPLGVIPINTRLRQRLAERSDIVHVSERGHRAEHALEVQLPFLQEVLPSFSLLPLVIGDQKPEICFRLGEALAEILQGENALLVASTDLSHFHSAKIANELDRVLISDVTMFDAERLMTDLQRGRTEACGGGPVVAVMTALKKLGVEKIEVVHHSNSGDVTGDHSSVVGYLSAVAYS